MKTIVLITRENSEKVTHAMVFLCSIFFEANHFCHLLNRLPLVGGDKLVARRITTGIEYSLEKYQPFEFDDFINVDNRTIQRVMREMDHEIKMFTLKTAKKEVKELFLRNTSKRSASMLEEDMEYMDPVTEQDIEKARQITLDIYDDVSMENRFDEEWARYENSKKIKNQDDSGDKNHLVLVFRGTGMVADCVSLYLFDKYDRYDSADHFCEYLNNLETNDGSFIYAKHAEQMVEYETTKPLLISFNQIFENGSRFHDEFTLSLIIKDALKKFSSKTILQAVKGLDKHSRMLFMQSLPIKTADEVNEDIEGTHFFSSRDSYEAQQKILNAINRTYDKDKKKYRGAEVIKD
jgi:hypothetical protein